MPSRSGGRRRKVTGITPASGLNNGSVAITNLSGSCFDTGPAPAVNLTRSGYANITATGVAVVNRSVMTCTFDLTGRRGGAWNVTVTNPDGQSATLVNGFTITLNAPNVTAITPKAGKRGTTVKITNLSGAAFEPGATVRLKKGAKTIAMKPATVASPVKITGKIKIPATAKTGKWNVTVTNYDGQNATLAGGFKVKA